LFAVNLNVEPSAKLCDAVVGVKGVPKPSRPGYKCGVVFHTRWSDDVVLLLANIRSFSHATRAFEVAMTEDVLFERIQSGPDFLINSRALAEVV
jgi:hypothetical protein